ncbi:MAG: hypothetical protein QG670_813 [Thermoproteota archaeon]|nr:hypothetical protein [Thermoproteota archaeon]
MLSIRKILVPTDGSTHALKAAAFATEIAKNFDSQIHILNVMMPPLRLGDKETSWDILNKTKEVLDKAGVKAIIKDPVSGNPAATICNISEKEKFDMIVIGSRGLSDLKSFFLGGISDKVSHHAVCPVLIVR